MNRSIWFIVYGLVCGLLATGLILLLSKVSRGDAIQLNTPPPPLPVVIFITGAIQQPGVYELPNGSRVQDAVQVAGGFTEQANPESINLAAILLDGQKILVPQHTPMVDPDQSKLATIPVGITYPLDLNTVDQVALETLPGIGPVTAEKIIAYRQEHGPFTSIQQIQDVSGIGPATFEQIKEFITVSPPP